MPENIRATPRKTTPPNKDSSLCRALRILANKTSVERNRNLKDKTKKKNKQERRIRAHNLPEVYTYRRSRIRSHFLLLLKMVPTTRKSMSTEGCRSSSRFYLLLKIWSRGLFEGGGVTEGGGFPPPWEVQYLSAMVPWHLDRHPSATSPSLLLLRNDQKLRSKCVTVQWRRAERRERHRTVIPGDMRMSFPWFRPPPLKMPDEDGSEDSGSAVGSRTGSSDFQFRSCSERV